MNLRLSITTKLTLIFVLFAALLLLAVGLLAYTRGRAALEAAITADLLSKAIEKEAALNAWVEDRQLDILALTRSPDLVERVAVLVAAPTQAKHDRVVETLQTWAGPGQQYLTLLVMDAETGRVMAATDPREEGKFKENRPYFVNGKNGPYVQNIYYSLVLQGPAMTAAAPLRSADGRLLGVLAGRLNLEELNVIINRRTGLHQTADAFLVNTSHLFVTQPRFISNPAILQRGNYTEMVRRCLTPSSGAISAEDYRGTTVIAVYRWLPERQLCLVAKLDQAEALAPAHAFGQAIVLIGGLALLVASLLAIGLARTITQPVLALQVGAVRFGQGELNLRLPETASDELGRLAREFNTMATALAEKEMQLRRYTEELERMVEARTAALRLNEERTRLIVESALDAVVTIDTNSIITGWNAQAEAVFGWSDQEALGQFLDLILSPQQQAAHHRGMAHFLATGEGPVLNRRIETTAQHRAGHVFPVELAISPVRMGDRFIFSAFIRDITERRQAEEALREREERFRLIADAAPVLVWMSGQDALCTFFNQPWLDFTGRTIAQELGNGWTKGVHPDDYDRCLAIYLAAFQAHQDFTMEYRLRRADGEYRWIVDNGVPRFEGDRFIGYIGACIDITERKRAEEQFRLVVEAAPNAILLVNPAGKMSLVNKRAEILFGYERAELLEQPVEMLVLPRLRNNHRDYLDTFFTIPTARPMGAGRDLFGLCKDGRQIPVEIGLNPISTSEGNFVLASILDITERKQAEAEIAESLRREQAARLEAETAQKRLAFLVEASNSLASSLEYHTTLAAVAQLAVPRVADWCAIDIVEPDGSIRRVAVVHSDPAKVAFAYELQRRYPPDPTAPRGVYQVLRTGQPEFYPEISENIIKAANLDETQLHILHKLGLKSAITVPMMVRNRALGTITFVMAESGRRYGEADLAFTEELSSRAALAVDNARLYHEARKLNEELEARVKERTAQLQATNTELEREIVERTRMEEELRGRRQELQDHIDSMSTLTAKVALDGTILLVNKIAQEASGLSMVELMQANFLEGGWWAFDPEVQMRVRQAFQQVCTGTPVNYDEQIFVFGQVLTISFSLVPVTGSDNQVAYIVAEGRDITALKQAEAALMERGTQLEAANKELEAFSYSVSHDLRAPLRSIDGFSQALLEDYTDKLDSDGQSYLQRIRAASQRMAELIEALLTLARATRHEIHREAVDLSGLARTIAEYLSQTDPQRQVEFVITPELSVKADARLLRAVLENLLGNAWKFTARQPQARIEVGSGQQDGQAVYFVRDDGAGFDMAYADKLFGAFQRLHAATEFTGTGIGLATVQRIIHRHGGHIWAEGAVGQGATFYFTLSG